MDDIVTIIVIIVMVISSAAGFIEKILKKAGKVDQAKKAEEVRRMFDLNGDEDEDEEVQMPAAPEPIPTPAPQPAQYQPVRTELPKPYVAPVVRAVEKKKPVLKEETPKKKLEIDKKKLVIYSEIMNRKYN